jgi:hypothetical protein
MAHVRQQIRSRIGTLLTSGVALVSSRVYGSRVYPLTEAKLPAVTVYAGAEQSGLITLGAKTLTRTLTVNVDVYALATANLDNDLDAICVQVEEAIAADFTLNGLAKTTVLSGTEIDFSGEAEQPVGVARLNFSVSYVTDIDDVETAR